MISKCTFKGMMLFIPLLLLSCNEKEQALAENKCKIICSVDKFESSNPSRTNTDPNNNYRITWASGDVIGIFPKEGYQEPFEIPTNQVGNVSTTFDGGYWAVKDGLKYNAYYPFDKRNFDSAEMKTRIPVTYKGQNQNGTMCEIGAFDYTYSDWKTATNGSISFGFHHLGSINVINLKYPATTTYTQMTLSVDEALIPLEGSYDLTANNVAMKADMNSLSTSISLDLTNCSGVAGEIGTFYLMLPPMDLSNNKVTVSLTSAAGTTCTYYLENELNIEKGKLYERTGIPTESNVEGTIEGWLQSYYYNGVAFVANAGELSSIIPEDEKYTITSLKVLGEINSTDIKLIRNMAGTNRYDLSSTDVGQLVHLNLRNATIVEGGEGYINAFHKIKSNVIGESMFRNCILRTLILPDNIISIESNAFSGCDALTSIIIPNNVIAIEAGVFSDCSSLESIILPNDLQSLGNYAFSFCTSLTSITIPDNVVTIGDGAFEQCSLLESIILPNKLTNLGTKVFEMCSSLWEIKIPDGVTEIQANTFYKCIAKIYLGNNISVVRKYGLTPYSNIHLTTPTPPTLEEDAIYSEEYDDGNGHFDIDSFLKTYNELPLLYVPYNNYDAYLTSGWSKYYKIEYFFD